MVFEGKNLVRPQAKDLSLRSFHPLPVNCTAKVGHTNYSMKRSGKPYHDPVKTLLLEGKISVNIGGGRTSHLNEEFSAESSYSGNVNLVGLERCVGHGERVDKLVKDNQILIRELESTHE
ncbi:hypothetical protein MMC07_001031 [Pseudocyphellaria aurata]|nr:hypothetical protein [Pseudocyphellaria aurata]